LAIQARVDSNRPLYPQAGEKRDVLWANRGTGVESRERIGGARMRLGLSSDDSHAYPQALAERPHNKEIPGAMTRLHLHLLSDSTGETLETVAKAGLAQFEGVEAVKHFWPMVRSEGHLDRVLLEIAAKPGLVIYTLVNSTVRKRLESRCHALGLHA